MKNAFNLFILFASLIAFPAQGENNTNQKKDTTMENNERTNIENLLLAYRDALNTSDVGKVLSLYTSDGVFMPSTLPSAKGTEQPKSAYESIFQMIQLDIEFFIDEIVVNGTYAYAQTTSRGKTLIHATGETVPEENRELFVIQNMDGKWKIARYMFNKMK